MSLPRPTLSQLVDANDNEINARLPGADARLPLTNLHVISRVLAMAAHGLYGALDTVQRMAMNTLSAGAMCSAWRGCPPPAPQAMPSLQAQWVQ
jgi:uncharacterized phage protein gp47/JayE